MEARGEGVGTVGYDQRPPSVLIPDLQMLGWGTGCQRTAGCEGSTLEGGGKQSGPPSSDALPKLELSSRSLQRPTGKPRLLPRFVSGLSSGEI